MFYRMLPVFTIFITPLFVRTYAENVSIVPWKAFSSASAENCSSSLLKIQQEIYNKMAMEAGDLMATVDRRENIQLFPITEAFRRSYMQIYNYRAKELFYFISEERFLEVSYTLAKLTKKLQTAYNSTDMNTGIHLSFQAGAFLRDIRENHDYFTDLLSLYPFMKEYFIPAIPYDHSKLRSSLRGWIEKVTIKRTLNNSTLNTEFPLDLVNTVVQFSGCWSHPMFRLKPNSSVEYRYDYYAPGQHFDRNDNTKTRPTFFMCGKVNYYKDDRLQYEAIKLPIGNEDFGIYVALPFENLDTSTFYLFSQEYVDLFNNVANNSQNMAIFLPEIDIAMVTIDEHGIDINSDNRKKCNAYLAKNATCTDDSDRWALENGAKEFYANRPFAVFLVHEKTKSVLWHAYVRNTTSREYMDRELLYPIHR